MHRDGTADPQLLHEFEIRVEWHDAFAERHVVDDGLAGRLRPLEIFHVGAANPWCEQTQLQRPRLGALHRAVADIVLHAERAGIDVLQHVVEIPNRAADTRARVILNRPLDAQAGVEGGEFLERGLKFFDRSRHAQLRVVVPVAEAVKFYAVFRRRAEERLGVRLAHAGDIGRDHLDLQTGRTGGVDRAREIFGDFFRQHVALRLAHGVVDAAVAAARDELGGLRMRHHVQRLREDVNGRRSGQCRSQGRLRGGGAFFGRTARER